MPVPKPPTSHDVARAAGVSQAAVSYALTGRGTISAATRERVLRVAESMGYRPNLAARSMRTRRTGRLAVVTGATLSSKVLTGAAEVAEAAGYATETHAIDGTVEHRTARVRDLAASRQYEGILTLVPVLTDELETPASLEDGTPVVAEATFDEQMRSLGTLADARPIEEFVTALAARGWHRFVHVAGSSQYASGRARRDAYVATVERLATESGVTSLGVLGGAWTGEAGRSAMHDLPDDAPPVAVIAGNDVVAAGVLRGAAERGWTVPDDLVVTGWDDSEIGAFMSPSLTTVAVDFPEAGRNAMRRLITRLSGEPGPGTGAPIHRIVWRESTGG